MTPDSIEATSVSTDTMAEAVRTLRFSCSRKDRRYHPVYHLPVGRSTDHPGVVHAFGPQTYWGTRNEASIAYYGVLDD